MAVVKGGKKKSNKDVEKPAKKRVAEVEDTVEEEVVDVERESTNPEDFTYLVKLEAKKFSGRDAEQVAALVFGALGAMKKITVEKE